MVINKYLGMLHSEKPENIRYYALQQINLDEANPGEIHVAFSFYEAFNEEERDEVWENAKSTDIARVLQVIGQNNMVIFEAIEAMASEGVPVLKWLEDQLKRMKMLLISFEEEIAERQQIASTRISTESLQLQQN